MNYKFEPKAVTERKTKIELVNGFNNQKTVVKYPTPEPRDRIDDEYDERDNSE